MKFSERWLKRWVDVDLPTAALCEQLTAAGLEVGGIEPVAGAFRGVVVARIVSTAPHPHADRLSVCQVDAGGEPATVVCGAPNVRAGMRSAYAAVGAELPDGRRIGRAALRGVESRGMLCSAAELGIGDDADGILDFDTGEPGDDLRAALELDDARIVLELTPNRGDALSIRGIAREVGALNGAAATPPEAAAPAATGTDAVFPVRIDNPSGCPRYLGRVIEDVDISRSAPWWLRERLRRCGLRSIDPIVDVTNYVLLELGQPMHAFDRDALAQGIVVRDALPGEALRLLDGREIAFDAARPAPLLIADARGPLAMAGVMGGARSGVSARTRAIFLECAYFDPMTVAAAARRFDLRTDAAHRYERGVDYALQAEAMERATELILGIAGGRAGPVAEAASAQHLPARAAVKLRKRRLDRVLGGSVPADEVTDILQRLGLAPQVAGAGADAVWTATAPSYRFDIAREEDLIEEVLRIHGFDAIDSRTPQMPAAPGRVPADALPTARLADALADAGFAEAITYSFVDPRLCAVLDPQAQPLRVRNPVSSEHAAMRTTLLPGLAQALARNLARQARRVRLFEIGQCFRQRNGELTQALLCGGILHGARHDEAWSHDGAPTDFFDAKGAVETLLALGGRRAAFAPEADDPALHPGQAARVSVDGRCIGRVGRLHPHAAQTLGLPDCFFFELAVQPLAALQRPRHSALSRHPGARRDIALRIAADVPIARIEALARDSLGELLREFRVFDLYVGEGIGAGEKGVGIGLTLQHPSRTLTDAEIAERVDAVVAILGDAFGARLR